MIIWLASYPKSGNTLLRSLLSCYFFSKDGSFNFNQLRYIKQFPLLEHFSKLNINLDNPKDVFKNFIKAQDLMNFEDKNLKFLKTHSSLARVEDCNFTNLKNTLGVIYIVRDPRNVVTSFANHYGITIPEATAQMTNKANILDGTEITPKTFMGSWDVHFNSWKQLNKYEKYLLIKYEDLITKKKTILIRILKFLNKLSKLNFKINMVKLNKVIKSTEFEKMKNLERKKTFEESLIDKNTGKKRIFFNLGPKNDWKKILDHENRSKIENEFKKEMKELGYL